MIGETISHYRILEKLGGGGMGIVYKAEDTRLKRTVALKFLPPELIRDEIAKERFIHEAQAASALQHPTICTIHDIDQSQDGRLFISMDCYEGETLKEKIASGQLSVDDAVDITVQIAKGLQRAHEKEIVHRDIKPANIYVTTDGLVKILDFGLAKLARQTRLTVSGVTLGTIAYMSPEQARGAEVDQRTDIWSLGVVLYEMVSGKVPFGGEFEQAVIYSILNEEPAPLADGVPDELKAIAAKALRKDPDERYQTIDEMLRDFEPLSREAAQYGDLTLSQFVRRALRKKRTRYAAISTAATLLAVIAFFIARPMIFPEVTRADLPSIAVVSFENETGDSAYDVWKRGISLLLGTKLEQSGGVRVTTWERINDLLKQLNKWDVQHVDAGLGFELCVKEGVQMLAVGSVLKAGETFSITVRLFDVATRELLASVSSTGRGEESILDTQVDRLAQDLSIKIGVSDTSLAKMKTSIAQVTTASPEAYKLYVQAMEKPRLERAPLLEQAIAIDSTFAMAYFRLAEATRERSKSREYRQRAFALRHRAADRERLFLDILYISTQRTERGIRDDRGYDSVTASWIKRYPRDKEGHFFRAMYLQYREEDYPAAIVEFEKAMELSEEVSYLNEAGYCYMKLKQYDQAIATFRRMLEKDEARDKYNRANTFDSIADVYLLKGDLYNAIANFKEAFHADSIKGKKNGYGMNSSAGLAAFSHAKAEEYAQALYWIEKIENLSLKKRLIPFLSTLCGQYNRLESEIPAFYSQAASEDSKTGAYDERRLVSLQFAWMYYEKGDHAESQRYLQRAKSYPWKDAAEWARMAATIAIHVFEGLRFVEAGEIDSARHCIAVLDSVARDTDRLNLLGIVRIPFQRSVLQAMILDKEGRLDDAIALLQGTPNSNSPRLIHISQFPFIDDMLARLLVKKGDIDGAIAEYERMTSPNLLDRKWRWIDARYHYHLAKLYEQKGWPGRAIERYQRFLKVWEMADQDIPEIIDAKRRLKNLLSKN